MSSLPTGVSPFEEVVVSPDWAPETGSRVSGDVV